MCKSQIPLTRVSYETSFDSKQPKLEQKLVSTLSETRGLFRLFRFNIETGTFVVSIESKQKENNRNKPKKVSKLFKKSRSEAQKTYESGSKTTNLGINF
jgi:hypothetical protein